MVKPCCIDNCDSNKSSEGRNRTDNEYVSLYRLPNKKKAEERQRWIEVIKSATYVFESVS